MSHCNLVFHVSCPILWLFIIQFTFTERSHLVSLLCKMSVLRGCLHDFILDLHGTFFVLFRNFAMVNGRRVKLIRVSRLFARKLIKFTPTWTIQFFKSVQSIGSWSRQPRCFLEGPFSRHCTNATLFLRSLSLGGIIRCRNDSFVFLLLHCKIAVLLRLTCSRICSFFASRLLILLLLAAIIIAWICTTLKK